MTAALSGNSGFSLLGLADNQNKLADLNSFFYKTLLRGGFNQNFIHFYETFPFEYDDIQATVTSNSNSATSSENDDNLKLLTFFNKLAFYFENNQNKIEEDSNGDDTNDVVRFLKVYDKNYDTNANVLNYAKTKVGGSSITELILRIFCVLIWHNSSITYKSLFSINEPNEFIRNEVIAHAYKAAESTRMFIIEQQQMFKLKHLNGKESEKSGATNHPIKSLIDILNEKVIYLLKFERLNEKTLNYEINKNNSMSMKDSEILASSTSVNHQHNQHLHHHHSANSIFNKKKKGIRYPKYELVPTFNVVFDFIFDKNINNLELITSILNLKRSLALLVTKNLDLASSFLSIFLSSPNENMENRTKSTLEYVLTYLSSFFSSTSSPQCLSSYNLKNATNSTTPNSNSNTNVLPNTIPPNNVKGMFSFPPTLQFGTVHYLQNLYACGITVEHEVQTSYFKFLTLLLNYSTYLKKPAISIEVDQKNLIENFLIFFFSFIVMDCL